MSNDPNLATDPDDMDYNYLNQLGNRAIALGLIVGHGYRQGKYEILSRREALLLSQREAVAYLQALIQSAEQTHD